MKKSAAFLLVLAGLCGLGVGIITMKRGSAAPPRLVTIIVVDQMRYDFLTRFDDLYRGGFRTLLDHGAVFSNARFAHGLTWTAAGHAVISTGLHPSDSAMVANKWYDAALHKGVNCVFDPAEHAVGGPGEAASPRPMLGDTLGDRMKEKFPGSHVVALSMKDRSAILLAGHKADAAYWFSDDCGCFITSSFYAKQAPQWLEAFNQLKLADSYAGKPWRRLIDDPFVYEKHSREDAFPSENGGKQTTFPHELEGKPPEAKFYASLGDSGFGDELLLEAALQAMRAYDLGRDDTPDLFAVSFSGTDRVGHAFGPFSQEAMDQHLRLDRLLGRLLEAIDAQAGLDHTVVVLTADHGGAPLAAWAKLQGNDAKLVPPTALADAVNQAIARRYPQAGDVIAYQDPPHLFFDLERLEKAGIPRSEAEELARAALLATGWVERVYTHGDMQRPAANDPYWQLLRNSFFEGRSPHLMLVLHPYYYVEGSQGTTGHGTPHDYDRHVPLIFFGGGIHKAVYDAACGPEDIVPTLGRLLGVPTPLEPDARILNELR